MSIDAGHAKLEVIPVNQIHRNPENPRIVFREKELDELLESIRTYGVQVPISVYKERNKFVLIDGERRWRCCYKLNKKKIPALVQEKPDPLTNLLLMFNIHALREQWDLLTIANRLPEIIGMIKNKTGSSPTESELSNSTGLTRSIIRRCKLLIEMPQKYRDQILIELKKPKRLQKLTEDFFIEMERALKTTQRALPDLIDDVDLVREVLIDKYKKSIITNIVHFRNIAKIARVEYVAESKSKEARAALKKLFKSNKYSIQSAYEDTVSEVYEERDLHTRINNLIDRLDLFEHAEFEEHLRNDLINLYKKIKSILEI